MAFYQKLNLLMKVQNISNSRLARALSLDPSLISRWRRGKRKPAKNNNYRKKISDYIASQAKMEYQKVALFEIMELDFDREQEKIYSISNLLYDWLSDKPTFNEQFIEGFFDKFDEYSSSSTALSKENPNNSISGKKEKSVKILSGIEGKRQGVIRFLSTVAAHNKPCTVLMYSDESMKWITEDKFFLEKGQILLKKVLSRGHKIKIIHTIKRDISELLSAVEYWVPLYMSGAIEPFFYPEYQKNIFRRTMFIAPGLAALTTSTITEHSNNAEQLFYTEKDKIDNLTEEFNTLLSMCKPLMHIFTGSNAYNFHKLQLEFEKHPGSLISFSDMFSFETMPESLLKKIIDRNTKDINLKRAVLSIYKERSNAFILNIKDNNYTEILNFSGTGKNLYSKKLIKANNFFSELDLNYTPSDFNQHIENIIYLIENYDNYNVIISKKKISSNIYIAIKEDVGVIMAKNSPSPTIFAFNQGIMTNSFYNYFNHHIKTISSRERNKDIIIEKLKEYIN